MNERFTLIDYTIDPLGVYKVIEEPVGWDAIKLRIARDEDWHGFFNFIDDSVNSLEFDFNAFTILQDAYQLQGALANVHLLIEFQCAEGDSYEQLYLGRFVFSSYKAICGDRCFSTCSVEALDCLMIFRNRYDQQVDLDSLNSFDDEPVLQSVVIDATFAVSGGDNTIDFIGDYEWMTLGMPLVITGTASNNSTFTIILVAHSIDSSSVAHTVVTVTETVVNEASVSATVGATFPMPNLTAYAALNKEITIPSKTIKLVSQWRANADTTYTDTNLVQSSLITPKIERLAFTPDWANVISEIDNTLVGEGIFIDGTGTPSYTFDQANPPDNLIYFTGQNGGGTLGCTGDITIELNFNYKIEFSSCLVYELKMYIVKDFDFNAPYTGQTTGPQQWVWDLIVDPFNFNVFNQTITTSILQNENIYIFFTITYSCGLDAGQLSLSFKNTNFFKVSIDSVCDPSPANVYLINETLARCTEAITNDCMTVYSDYFGRTDAQPYASDVNGCMGFRSISNGLKIRNAPSPNGFSSPRMTVSMKDCFDALNATDNIGMGLEDDPNRPGQKLIRVEPVHYFYNDSVLLTCDHIRTVNRDVDPSIIYSKYRGGYAHFETWNANGLFDLYAGREYRTELSELKNELERVCKFIASDYAIEVTRRQYGTTTSDWRYDSDIFFLCLANLLIGSIKWKTDGGAGDTGFLLVNVDYTAYFQAGDTIVISNTSYNNGTYTVVSSTYDILGNTFVVVSPDVLFNNTDPSAHIYNLTKALPFLNVKQGIVSGSNVLFPESVINYEIVPSRNAMRWLKTILQSYRQYLTGKLRFTKGTGNIVGQGLVNDDTGCRIENQLIQEKMDIDLNLFETPEDNYPIFFPELVKFEYPLSYADYLNIIANPYGLIGFQCGENAVEYGWIEDLQYSPYEGMAEFTLRTKI